MKAPQYPGLISHDSLQAIQSLASEYFYNYDQIDHILKFKSLFKHLRFVFLLEEKDKRMRWSGKTKARLLPHPLPRSYEERGGPIVLNLPLYLAINAFSIQFRT
jgi:hypothetical protein